MTFDLSLQFAAVLCELPVPADILVSHSELWISARNETLSRDADEGNNADCEDWPTAIRLFVCWCECLLKWRLHQIQKTTIPIDAVYVWVTTVAVGCFPKVMLMAAERCATTTSTCGCEPSLLGLLRLAYLHHFSSSRHLPVCGNVPERASKMGVRCAVA